MTVADQSPRRIMVVDDDLDGLEVLRTRLVHAGYEVETADSAEKALARVKAFEPGLIVTDVRMGGMTPGCTELTRMPSLANCTAADLVMMRTAPLDAL